MIYCKPTTFSDVCLDRNMKTFHTFQEVFSETQSLWLLLLWWIKLNLSHLSVRPSVKACGALLCVSVINSDRKWHALSASISRPAARRQPLVHFSARRFSLLMRGHVTWRVIKGLKKTDEIKNMWSRKQWNSSYSINQTLFNNVAGDVTTLLLWVELTVFSLWRLRETKVTRLLHANS